MIPIFSCFSYVLMAIFIITSHQKSHEIPWNPHFFMFFLCFDSYSAPQSHIVSHEIPWNPPFFKAILLPKKSPSPTIPAMAPGAFSLAPRSSQISLRQRSIAADASKGFRCASLSLDQAEESAWGWENGEKLAFNVGKPWGNHGKTMGKPWENHRRTMGEP